MISNSEGLSIVHLKPGEAHLTDRAEIVVTVLGSCLSVTMFNRRRGVAGICHSLLPACGNRETCRGACREGYRYVACSIRQMVGMFDRYAIPRGEIEVKCFGGAAMFTRKSVEPELLSIGRQNISMAEKIIANEGLRLLVKDVGGLRGRKVLFYTHTGEVLLKRLRSANDQDRILQEIIEKGAHEQ